MTTIAGLSLEEIKAQCERAAPAPWTAAAGPSSVVGWPVVASNGRLICRMVWRETASPAEEVQKEEARAHAWLIANSRTLVPALVERVRELEAALGELAATAEIDMKLNQGGDEAGSHEDVEPADNPGGWWSLRTEAAIAAARAALTAGRGA